MASSNSSFVIFVGFCLFCIGCTVAQHLLIAEKTYPIGAVGTTLPNPVPTTNCTPEPDILVDLKRITDLCYIEFGEGVMYHYNPNNSTYYYYKYTYTFPNCTGSIKRTDQMSVYRCGTLSYCPGSVYGTTCSAGWSLSATKTLIRKTTCECTNSTEGMIINYKRFGGTNCNGNVQEDIDLEVGSCRRDGFAAFSYTPLLIPGFPLMVTRYSFTDQCNGDGTQTIVQRNTCVGGAMYTYPEICTCTTEPIVTTTGALTTSFSSSSTSSGDSGAPTTSFSSSSTSSSDSGADTTSGTSTASASSSTTTAAVTSSVASTSTDHDMADSAVSVAVNAVLFSALLFLSL